ESVYQNELANRLTSSGMKARVEFPVEVSFDSFVTIPTIDLIVADSVLYELKAVRQLMPEHEEQLLNYLLLTNTSRGKVINFRSESVESRFVNAPLQASDRHQFSIDTRDWNGNSSFQKLIEDLVSDWGTSLDQSLYIHAVTHCLGGKEQVVRSIPMSSQYGPMGNQRFHLVDDETAFQITMFPRGVNAGHAKHLEKMIAPSSLKQLYWVNIARNELRFQTITNISTGRFGTRK
ncbi:MAG: GxxExxY protein, partial [Planctomycetes bacterium]|nr:GxxExxY protein [Planctomycetota bacterium]